MNQKIETLKIKVNNGQELIAKAREYKNSGGEWKLLEKYLEQPTGNAKNPLEWGIIISNSKKKVNICSLGEKGFCKSGIYDEIGVRDQLHQLFPEAKPALYASEEKGGSHGDGIGRPHQSKLDHETCRLVEEVSGECNLFRYLVAENAWHLTQIVHQWVQENKTIIQQSPNSDFNSWVEIIDGQDGNMYLYVGKKNDDGGREIKIGIKKDKYFEEVKGDEIQALLNSSESPDKNNKSNDKINQLKDSEKSQILSYFLAKNISKISLESGKLVIEYKDNSKKVMESEDQQLQKYHQYIQNLPNQSLSLSDLQNNNSNNSSTSDKSNTGIYVGLTAGAVILGGIFVYFLVRKKKK